MTEGKDCWIVMIGGLYCCGLGHTFDGYLINGEPITGMVVSHARRFAFEFTSYRSAKILADSIGGQVFKG